MRERKTKDNFLGRAWAVHGNLSLQIQWAAFRSLIVGYKEARQKCVYLYKVLGGSENLNCVYHQSMSSYCGEDGDGVHEAVASTCIGGKMV